MKAFLSTMLLLSLVITSKSQDGTGLMSGSGTPIQSGTQQEKSYKDLPMAIKENMALFFQDLIKGDIEKGYDRLLENSPIKRKTKSLSSLVEKTEYSVELYGNMFDYEPVSVEIATSSYFRVKFLSLHTRNPMRWVFTYYRSPDKGWIITNILYDDQTENFFYEVD
jgi:hypothetical protein